MKLLWLLCCFFAMPAVGQQIPRPAQVVKPPVSPMETDDREIISRSGQFRISGGISLLRGTVAILADETKGELLRLTGEKDDWKVPVTIRLHGNPGDPLPPRTVNLSLLVVEGQRGLRLDVHLSRGIEQERFKRAVTSALLYERTLEAGMGEAAEQALIVPPWLTDGLREATAWRLNESDRRLYEALFKRGGLFKLDELFMMDDRAFDDLDGATRAAFRVSSGALVMALLEQPQGKEGFRAFLSEVAAYEGEMPGLLRKHFPELNLSETSLSKWWALQLAAKGGVTPLTDILTIQQTDAALAEALRLNFRNPEGVIQQKEITAWQEVVALNEPGRFAAVRPAQDALVRLSYRCFPSYRPLLAEYQLVLDSIAKNKGGEVAKRLADLEGARATMMERALRARDYLDWFEITRARETSGAFDDYQRLKERLQANPHQRKDCLSAYLDRMDRIFYREQKVGPALSPR